MSPGWVEWAIFCGFLLQTLVSLVAVVGFAAGATDRTYSRRQRSKLRRAFQCCLLSLAMMLVITWSAAREFHIVAQDISWGGK
jgi:hypothetical protein